MQAVTKRDGTRMVTIKVTETVHSQLLKLANAVQENGWQHLGLSRNDRPTISTLILEALNKFKKR